MNDVLRRQTDTRIIMSKFNLIYNIILNLSKQYPDYKLSNPLILRKIEEAIDQSLAA